MRCPGKAKAICSTKGAPRDRIAITLFAEDDAAFVLDLVGIEEHAVGVVAEELHALVDHGGVALGQLEFVNGLVEGGVGVGVVPEAHPEALEVFDHLAGGEVLRPVEGHVLEEVGETLLVVVLHERPGIDEEAHADAVRRFRIRRIA